MDWFMERVGIGDFEVINPYNKRTYIVPAEPERIHTIVFWSKNFDSFIKNQYGETLIKMGYNLYFNFTINSEDPILEPNIPPLEGRLYQLEYLCNRFNPKGINWRFDPICFYKKEKKGILNNLDDFPLIAETAARSGIKRCTTSFMDHYEKVRKRVSPIPGFTFINPLLEEKISVIHSMEKILTFHGIVLSTCCEKELMASLPDDTNIKRSSCIPNDLLMKLFGGRLSVKKDAGQRVSAGCGCMVSKDIGSYSLHPCYHNCLFCYANPTS